ncbi:MAG: 50S ribosomal protein L13 [Candidatus Aenigmarchaeota archaeon]|nr:50S ribosomal protein L13 [Candidatus Aenigmarchaeota archaeon]
MILMIIDATDTILGRMAVVAAKKALLGEEVMIINAEKAIVTGSRKVVLARFKFKRDVGDQIKGPFYPRMPDRLVRRVVRGMLPIRKTSGLDAYKRVKAFIGKPADIKGDVTELKDIKASSLKDPKYIYVEEISKWLGAKW